MGSAATASGSWMNARAALVTCSSAQPVQRIPEQFTLLILPTHNRLKKHTLTANGYLHNHSTVMLVIKLRCNDLVDPL